MSGPTADDLAGRIADWLPAARWFAGKGSGPTQVAIADETTLTEAGVILALVDARSDGDAGRYCVPVTAGDGADAAATAGFCHWLLATVLEGGGVAGWAGRFAGFRVAGEATGPGSVDGGEAPRLELSPASLGDLAVEPLGGDASNTSLLVTVGGGAVAVKLIRRCQAGTQPEVEVGRFLAAEAGWQETPPLLGWLAYEPADGSPPRVLATVHTYLAGCRTAWEAVGELVAAGGLRGPAGESLRSCIATIGRLTGEMHAALASRPDLPAFAPATPRPATCVAEAAGMAAHARSVLARVAARAASAPPPLAHRLTSVAAAAERLANGFSAVADPAAMPAMIRVHGDYHLGQMLIREADGRVFPIDFEGEPSRPLAERRAKTSPAKDVAGMCRSFDYLLRHAARSGGPAYSSEDLATLEGVFLEAYESVAAGQSWWPADRAVADRLLAAWKLDKAIYELGYELDNRPDWAEVPLAAVEAYLAGAT